MRKIKQKSVIPIYGIGITWLVYSSILPMYRISDLLVAAVLSILAYVLLSKIIPEKTILAPEELHFEKSGVTETDAVISRGKEYLVTLNKLKNQIQNEQIMRDIEQLSSIGEKIFLFMSKNPGNTRQIKTFMDYYFPTTIKLLESFVELKDQPVAGENINNTIERIESVTGSIVEAFQKQLDNLFEDKALDIKTDIDVLKKILASEGFSDSGKLGGSGK